MADTQIEVSEPSEKKKNQTSIPVIDTAQILYVEVPEGKNFTVEKIYINQRPCQVTVSLLPPGKYYIGRERRTLNSLYLMPRKDTRYYKLDVKLFDTINTSMPRKAIVVKGQLARSPFILKTSNNVELEPEVRM